MNIEPDDLAQLLIGIARSQQAVVDAMESARPGFKSTFLTPALDSAAEIGAVNRPVSLQELPSRVLLQCQGRMGPNAEQLSRDLQTLFAAASAPAAGSNRP